MFDYEVMEEEEAMQERYQIMKEGEYDAVIEQSEDKVSSNSGNPMMAMVLTVYDQEGRTHQVRDYLVFTKNMMWKVIHCADSAGLSQEYKFKKFCSSLVIGKRVRVKLGIEAGKEIPMDKLNGKPYGSRYPDKNKVDDYVKKSEQMPLGHAVTHSNEQTDDDVPF